MNITEVMTLIIVLQEKREEWIDMLRGFGMLLVVIGHSRYSDILEKFNYGFHMPLFVLAGFLFHETKCR